MTPCPFRETKALITCGKEATREIFNTQYCETHFWMVHINHVNSIHAKVHSLYTQGLITKESDGFTYMVEIDNHVKIGYTKRSEDKISERFKELDLDFEDVGGVQEVLGIFDGGSTLESRIHWILRESRVPMRGEMFDKNDPGVQVLVSLGSLHRGISTARYELLMYRMAKAERRRSS